MQLLLSVSKLAAGPAQALTLQVKLAHVSLVPVRCPAARVKPLTSGRPAARSIHRLTGESQLTSGWQVTSSATELVSRQ